MNQDFRDKWEELWINEEVLNKIRKVFETPFILNKEI
jgi:hypothetical protein